MIEIVLSELLKSAVSVAKDILGDRVKEKNKELLERKRKKEYEAKKKQSKDDRGLTKDELNKILLLPSEEVQTNINQFDDKAKNNILLHLETVKGWCGFVGFKDLHGEKKLNDIYVHLDTYLMPLRTHISEVERDHTIPLLEALFTNEQHAIVLGQPGAGKTTSMKKLCSTFFNNELKTNYSFPILIRFRDLNSQKYQELIKVFLLRLLDIDIDISGLASVEIGDEWKNDSIYTVINEIKPIIILDGFDELSTQKQKDSALKEIREFTRNCRNAKFILTCRTGEFNFNLDSTRDFEISSLSEEQISLFAENWISNDDEAKQFVIDIKNSPFSDTAIKPLSLAHLCAIYQRTGMIPDRPKTVYRKVVNLMLEEWDSQRSIRRESLYSKFEPDRKFEFLNHLSYHLTVNGNSAVFSQRQLIEGYTSICQNFGLPKEQCSLAANEIESHTGLLLQTGYLQYEFAHKSLQEYLTAEYLVKLPSLERVTKHIEILGAELAIATSISSNPSIYFSDIVLGIFNRGVLTDSFYNAFVNRLIQERVDFYPSEELVLASFTLLSHRVNDDSYIRLMKVMLSGCDIGLLTEYYDLEAQDIDNTIILSKYKDHCDYKLKTKLRVPAGYFSETVLTVA